MRPRRGRWGRSRHARAPGPGRLARGYARLVVRLRWVLLAGWAALAVAVVLLPAGPAPGGGGLGGLLDEDNPAISAEVRSFQEFGFPLLSRVVVVQRDPDGLSVAAQAGTVLRAVQVDQGQGDVPLVLGALPLTNSLDVLPGTQERGTAALTYLFLPPRAGFQDQLDAAKEYGDRYLGDPDDALVGVTGSIPARAVQAGVVERALPGVETATIVAIGLLVALAFRSPVAAGVALVVAGAATVTTIRAVNAVAAAFGLAVPDEVRPLLVALLLGVVTDYCVFFLAALRTELEQGQPSREAVERAVASTVPIVLVAGITVSAGTGALVIARSPLFQGLGPGLALTVLLALGVTLTLVPAVLAVLGARSLAPGVVRARHARRHGRASRRLVEVLTRPRAAAAVVAATSAALVLAALPLTHLDLGVSFIASLPSDEPVAVAAREARAGFAPGIVAPTEVLLEGTGLDQRRAELASVAAALQARPDVDAALGPGSLPLADRLHVFVTEDGGAARLFLVLASRPLSATAVDTVTSLREDLPGLLTAAGLPGVRVSLAGDTALSELLVRATQRDLLRLSVAALLANLLMLLLFLRAVWTSLLLLLTSVLSLGATLGLTVLVFQDLLGQDGLTFYVPFAAAVLLVSLGSDYNIFAVGKVWEQARHATLADALRTAVPDSSRAITAAALTLAASFGLLALVPLRPFRELAFAMALGVLLDAVVVRSLLVPSVLTLLGRHASGRVSRAQQAAAPPVPAAA